MSNTYVSPFDWNFSDDKTLLFVDNSMDKEAVEDAIEQALADFDIKLEGQDLLYKLIVNGQENGSINIPEDQFLKSATYDSETKKFTFVVGDTTIDVDAADLFDGLATTDDLAEVTEKNEEQDAALENLATKEELNAVDAKFDNVYTKEEIDNAGFLTEHQDISNLATKAEVEAVEEKIPSIDGLATETWVEEQGYLTEHQDISALATKAEVEAVDTKVDNLEIPSIDGLASETWVEEQGYLTEHQDISNLATKAEVETVEAKIPSIEGLAVASEVTEEIATAIEPLATKQELTEAAANAVAQVVANAPEDLDTLKEVADYIASDKTKATEIETALSEHGTAIETLGTTKADKSELATVATSGDYNDLLNKPIIPDVSGFAVKSEVDASLDEKANSEDVYTKIESDETFQPLGEYVPVETYNELMRKVASLENYVNIFIKDREEKMDEIINNMDANNKEVTIETPMESIVVPETNVGYTITAPLTDNSTVELTSPQYMTLFNTSEEPVSTTIGHTYVEGESTTSGTTVYLVGDFDTLTLENVSPAVKSGQDAATVNNVVITENNVKNLSLAVSLQDGATITNNSNTSITIQDKNNIATTLAIVAPNSTVTLNGGTFTTLEATVGDDTLIIKKISHIENLNVLKGNVQVEVSRASDISTIVENYTLAEGCEITYLSDEVDTTNVANLQKAGEHTLVDDVTRTGNFSTGTFSSDDIVWNLNGHSITCDSTRGIGGFLLRNASKLEVNGEGSFSVIDDGYGLWASGPNVKIVVNNGDFSASTHVLYCEKGTIEVNGGTFRLTNEDTADKDENGNFKFLLNCLDANYRSGIANIIVRGGKFYDFDPGNCAAEGVGTSFLAEGYGSVMTTETIDGVEHKVYEVKPINE